jgi:hypothetical protein
MPKVNSKRFEMLAHEVHQIQLSVHRDEQQVPHIIIASVTTEGRGLKIHRIDVEEQQVGRATELGANHVDATLLVERSHVPLYSPKDWDVLALDHHSLGGIDRCGKE